MQETRNTAQYDDYLDRIKAISILDICKALNIETVYKGRWWCRLRDERAPSTLLNTDTFPNSYIDYGATNRKSDVIQFVCDATGQTPAEAIRTLATTFNIKREKQQGYSNDLSNWEYKKLGLHGDLATKNFSFDLERQGIKRVAELSEKYAMSMNELRRKHPKTYEKLLYNISVPLIREQRNAYYLELICLHQLIQTTDLSKYPTQRQSLQDMVGKLQDMERIFEKATEKTGIQAHPVGNYEPEADLKKLASGELRPSFGSHNKKQMEASAAQKRCSVKYKPIPFARFSSEQMQNFQHSAFYQKGQMIVGYLESDYAALKPILDKMSGKEPLKDRVAGVEDKRPPGGSFQDMKVQHQAER